MRRPIWNKFLSGGRVNLGVTDSECSFIGYALDKRRSTRRSVGVWTQKEHENGGTR
jgi:hypothetical protein